MRSKALAIFSFVGIPAWLAFTYLMVLGASLGDGTTGMPLLQGKVLLLPVIYLFILFLCSFRFIKGGLLALGGALSIGILLGYAVGVFAFGWGGILLWLPLIPYALASRKLFRETIYRNKKETHAP